MNPDDFPAPREGFLITHFLVVSDQERHRGWLPSSVRLPWRERLRAEGLELTNHYTHSSPCSPSRASLFTGRYISQHVHFLARANGLSSRILGRYWRAMGCIPADHMEQLGQKNLPDVNVRTGLDMAAFYTNLAGDLAAKGF